MEINLFEKYDTKLDDMFYKNLKPSQIAVCKYVEGEELNWRDKRELNKIVKRFRKATKRR